MEDSGASAGSWRFAEPADAPFLYDLALELDPRCWRLSRHGTHPMRAVEAFGEYSAAVVVLDGDDSPCGFAGLVNVSGTARCAYLDLHAWPSDDAVRIVSAHATEIVTAAFAASPVDHLYLDRFDGDPDLLASMNCWSVEVVMPEFAHVDGELATRTTVGVSRAEFDAWREAHHGVGTPQ